jgi:hypothetical protein
LSLDRLPAAPAAPFAIGLRPLGDDPWLIIDDRLDQYRAEKQRLGQANPERVFAAEPNTLEAQQIVEQRIRNWLSEHAPNITVSEPSHCEPLARAGMLIAEDLVIMRRSKAGWRLVAASLHFPSSWRLADKFGHPLAQVHAPVPGFGHGTRNALLIERIFDNLQPQTPVLRGNWAICSDDALSHHGSVTPLPANPAQLYLRQERQTLTRLPQGGDILFTILVRVDPMPELAATTLGRKFADELTRQLAAMSDDEARYKGMEHNRTDLVAALQALTSADQVRFFL